MHLQTTCAAALVLAATAWGGRPVVTWTGYPVRAGDRVLVHGGDWGPSPRVEAGGRTVEATVLSDSGLVFPFPADREAIVEGRVVNADGASAPFALNAPTVWWLQGDGGDSSTPGGVLRIFGRSLAPYGAQDSDAPVPGGAAGGEAVAPADGGRDGVSVWFGGRKLAVLRSDVWSLDAQVPADMKPGTYPVQVSNGLPGGKDRYDAGVWTVAAPRRIWKDDVFDVEDYGAEPYDSDSDSDAFDAALAAAAANGGGTVFVPRGRYVLTRTLVLPPHVLLKGEDRARSQICWPDTMTPPENLVEGTHSFGIHDLFISSGQYRNGIVAQSEMAAADCMASARGTLTHDVSLKRLTVKFVSDQWREERDLANFLPRYSMRGDGILVRNCLRGEIEDVELHCDKDAQRTLFFNFTGDYIRMAACRITGSGWAIFGGDRCIFERNIAHNCTYSISSVCRRMFWSGNIQRDLYTNNREAVTHDGAKTAWHAKKHGEQGCATGVVKGTHVTLAFPENIRWKSGTNYLEWVGCELQVTDGRGAGQTREIVSMKDYGDLEIDRPFDLVPDATSLFVVVAERKHLLYVDNDIADAGVAIQLYGGVTDCVVARNRCRRAGGFHGSGRDYHGVITCWNVQFLGNVVEEGNCHRGSIGTDFRGAGASLIGAFPPNVRWPFSQSYVYRDNVIESNGSLFISVKNALVERNTVRRSAVGVTSRRYQETMVVADNVFDQVDQPYVNLEGARISPAFVDKSQEEFLAQLRAGTFKGGRKRALRRAFGIEFRPKPWDLGLRAAMAGRSRRPFRVPVTLKLNGVLRGHIASASVRVPDAGGWTFGGATALTWTDDHFAGELAVTPPREGAVGMFTWPVEVALKGQGWSFTTEVRVNPLEQNRFLAWEAALSAPGANPTTWRKVKFMEGMDGHESVFPDKLYGDAAKGKDIHLRTRIEVRKATRFAFTRGSMSTALAVDGKVLIPVDASMQAPAEVVLGPGVHELALRRAAGAKDPPGAYAGLYLHCTFPDGSMAGDWTVKSEE